MQEHILYALSNPSLPGLIKIGITKNLKNRLHQLYSTSIPTPFEVVNTIEFKNDKQAFEAEKFLHSYLWLLRDNDNREFFTLTPTAVNLLFDKYRKQTLPEQPELNRVLEDVEVKREELNRINNKISEDIVRKKSQLALIERSIKNAVAEYRDTSEKISHGFEIYNNTITNYFTLDSINSRMEDKIKQKRADIRIIDSKITTKNTELNTKDIDLKLKNMELEHMDEKFVDIQQQIHVITKSANLSDRSKLHSIANDLRVIYKSYSVFNPVRYWEYRKKLRESIRYIKL